MRLLAFFFLIPTVASFVVVPKTELIVGITSKLAMVDEPQHQDHIIPKELLPEISQARRERILGSIQDMDEQIAQKEDRHKKGKQKKHHSVEETHPHLAQMSKLLDEHIVHEIPIDPNA